MTPGERVTVITKIASAISARSWTEIDLTLDQFGLSTSDSWQGDEYSYVVEQIKRAEDAKLLELHDYLFPAEATTPLPDTPREEDSGGIWEGGYFRLFISHSSKQSIEVGQLKAALRPYAIDGFVAHDDISPTDEWRDVIEVALRTCEAMTAYVTEDFHPSNWTDQEVGVALARAVLVIPIRKGATPYGFMGKYQALSGANKGAERLAQDIAGILQEHSLTAKRYTAARETFAARAAVEAFESANSFNEARTAWQVLRQIPARAFPPELLDRIEAARTSNGQLIGAQWAFGPTTVADEAGELVARARAANGGSPS
jgi:hypothetical protein